MITSTSAAITSHKNRKRDENNRPTVTDVMAAPAPFGF